MKTLFLLFLGFVCALGSALGKKPNLLFILVDDLGFGDLSSHGAKDMRTPHVDALMEAGMRFDNGYANCPVCSPTRASLMTGRYPDLVGVPGVIRTHAQNNWGFFDPAAVTLPDMLNKAGYHTALVGKWHLGLESPNTPNERGFDHFHGYLGDMMDDYYKHRRHGINYMRLNGKEIHPKGHATDLFTQWSIDYLKERSAKPDEPFFLYLAYNAPHTPIQPPKEWIEKVKARESGISDKRAKLVALIEHMDEGIGKVMEAIKANGQDASTLVVFTSDNGGQGNVGATNGPYRGAKQDMYEGGIRVPTCAVWPGKIEAGSRTMAHSLTMDWYPTLCEAAGVGIEHEIEGKSLLSVLRQTGAMAPRDHTIWVRREGGQRYGGQDYYAIRKGPWKYVQNTPFEPMQLYHLGNDRKEASDVAPKNPKVARELREKLMRHFQKAGRVPWQRP